MNLKMIGRSEKKPGSSSNKTVKKESADNLVKMGEKLPPEHSHQRPATALGNQKRAPRSEWLCKAVSHLWPLYGRESLPLRACIEGSRAAGGCVKKTGSRPRCRRKICRKKGERVEVAESWGLNCPTHNANLCEKSYFNPFLTLYGSPAPLNSEFLKSESLRWPRWETVPSQPELGEPRPVTTAGHDKTGSLGRLAGEKRQNTDGSTGTPGLLTASRGSAEGSGTKINKKIASETRESERNYVKKNCLIQRKAKMKFEIEKEKKEYEGVGSPMGIL